MPAQAYFSFEVGLREIEARGNLAALKGCCERIMGGKPQGYHYTVFFR